ncbi:hypothetical protein DINM_020298 [Dirofilaria immitis]|nr:hypothetical protein [Dirofilaria immitis]
MKNQPRRYSQYQSPKRHLIRIACIDICKINATDNPISDEHKQGSTAIRWANNANEFTISETTTTTATTTTTTTTTTTATITATETTNTAIISNISISITNDETITEESIEEKDSTNSVIIPTTTNTFSNTKILIRDIQLPNRTILHTFANETSPLWIYLQKILQRDMSTYHSGIETYDNNDKTTINNSRTFDNNISSRSKIRFLEEIVHELRENPNKYEISVERIDDHQNWLVILIGNYHKHENIHEATFTEVPKRMHGLPTKRDSLEESKPNYHVLRIKFPYKFLNNSTSDETEIQGKEDNTDSHIDKQRFSDHVEKFNFEKLPEKYVDNQHGYLYRVQIHDINRDLPLTNSTIINNEIRQQDENKSKEIETIENKNENVIRTKTSSAINSSCFGMINHQLLYNASYKILYDISLERCRCACATTWNNNCAMKCKSFQYSNVTRKCLLNEDDHDGKFDLVYSLDTNYFYKICTDQDIIKSAVQNCPPVGKLKLEQFVSEGINANSDLISADENKTIHSTKKRSTIDDQSIFPAQSVYWWRNAGREEMSNKGFVEELIISPGLWSRILKKESTAKNLKNLLIEIIEKQSQINTGKYGYNYWSGNKSGTTASYTNREIRSTKDENLETIQKSFATITISSTTTTVSPTTTTISSTPTTISSSTTIISSTLTTISEIDNTKTTIDLSSSYEKDELLAEESEESEEKEIAETNEQDEIKEDNSDNEKLKKSGNEYNSSVTKLTTMLIESEVTINQQTTTGKDPEFDEEEGFDGNSDDYSKNYNLNIENSITGVAKESSEMIINEKFSIPEADSEESIDYSDSGINKSKQNSTSKAAENCFEVIDGFMLKGTAGGLEQGVTLEECQCYCANSRSNKRYSFQCVSATYYHNEHDCVLNLQTRNNFSKQFKQNFLQQYNVSYLEMICSIEESKQQLVNPNLIDGCRQTIEISISTTKPRKVFQPINTDSCFIELPNHVLHGTAFAAETDVSVEACKCYCINAENRYGTECRSIEYYFDSMTCLLNNISRTTNPKNFNHSTAFTLMHSYFDKICSIRNDKSSIYIKEKCLSIISFSDKTTSFYSNEIGEEENEDEKSEEISDSEDDNTLMIYTTTAFPTVQKFTTFTTVINSFSKFNNTTNIPVITTPTYMDYTISNEISITTQSEEIITYPYLGKCEYSAIYQTSFRGVKLIKKFLVFSPQQCFYGCHFEGCRSLNLIQIDNQTKSCELFSDALIDYRTADVLAYDSVSVYFDGIKCMQKRHKVDKSSNNDNDYNTIDNKDYDNNN